MRSSKDVGHVKKTYLEQTSDPSSPTGIITRVRSASAFNSFTISEYTLAENIK